MRSILRHGNVKWAIECYFISLKKKIRVVKHPKEIETLLHKYEKFSEIFHMVDHLIGGLSITLFLRRVLHPFRYHNIEIPRISEMRLRIPFNNS